MNEDNIIIVDREHEQNMLNKLIIGHLRQMQIAALLNSISVTCIGIAVLIHFLIHLLK